MRLGEPVEKQSPNAPLQNVMAHGVEAREQWDERVPGDGDIIQAVPAEKEIRSRPMPDVIAILESVASVTGIPMAEIPEPGRKEELPQPGAEFYNRAHKEGFGIL
jgi:hypothetical protein